MTSGPSPHTNGDLAAVMKDLRHFLLAVSCVSCSFSIEQLERPASSIIFESPPDFDVVESDFVLKLKVLRAKNVFSILYM